MPPALVAGICKTSKQHCVGMSAWLSNHMAACGRCACRDSRSTKHRVLTLGQGCNPNADEHAPLTCGERVLAAHHAQEGRSRKQEAVAPLQLAGRVCSEHRRDALRLQLRDARRPGGLRRPSPTATARRAAIRAPAVTVSTFAEPVVRLEESAPSGWQGLDRRSHRAQHAPAEYGAAGAAPHGAHGCNAPHLPDAGCHAGVGRCTAGGGRAAGDGIGGCGGACAASPTLPV